ncbi:hypothetical protein V6K52_02205 [Knoellia sp. S7-12]|uniref:hypothetical protein n=1 Tax=Knoellia sp. S7-12 TaxID=3126698 RepID=UPI003367B675
MNNTMLPPPREYSSGRFEAEVSMLEGLADRGTRKRPARRWMVVGGVAAAGVALAGAAVVTGTFSKAEDKSLVRCHTTTDLGRGKDFAGTSTSVGNAQGLIPIDRALESCADLWRQGVLTLGAAQPSGPRGSDAAVPELVGCVDPDGFAAVFPGREGLCSSLGLTSLAEGP